MSTASPLDHIPKQVLARLGRPDAGTRIYRKHGPEEDMAEWFNLLTKHIGPSLSPGGVRMYCPVSRAAVHKRTKEGKLSIFLYHPSYEKIGWFGEIKTIRTNPYGYIPLSEVHAWRQEIEERAIQKNAVTREELEGSQPDFDGDHFNWQNKKEKPSLLDLMREEGYDGPLDLLKEMLASLVKLGKHDGPPSERMLEVMKREKERRLHASIEQTKRKARKKRGKT